MKIYLRNCQLNGFPEIQQMIEQLFLKVANHECLNYNSKKNKNPLLISSEMNQVVDISSYNQNLRDQVLVQKEHGVAPQNQQTLNQMKEITQEDQVQNSKRGREMSKNLVDIHNLLMLLATIAQKNSDLWRSIKSCSQNKQLENIGENAKKALLLLMNTHYQLSRNQMKDLIDNSEKIITQHVTRLSHEQPQHTQQLLRIYFEQENYKCFIQNLKVIYNDCESHHKVEQEELLQMLKQIGFVFDLNKIQEELAENIELAFFNLKKQIIPICELMVTQNDKLVLTLFAYLLILRYYENRIKSLQFDFRTYDELIETLENTNFCTPQQLLKEIVQFQNNLKAVEVDEDEDEDEDEDS